MNDVSKFVSIRKLENNKDIELIKNGKGFYIQKDNCKTMIFNNKNLMSFLAYIEFPNNKIKGNHYHNNKEENMLIVNGELRAKYFLPTSSEDVLELILFPGDIVTIKPGCVHCYETDNGAAAIEFSPNDFDENDSFDYE